MNCLPIKIIKFSLFWIIFFWPLSSLLYQKNFPWCFSNYQPFSFPPLFNFSGVPKSNLLSQSSTSWYFIIWLLLCFLPKLLYRGTALVLSPEAFLPVIALPAVPIPFFLLCSWWTFIPASPPFSLWVLLSVCFLNIFPLLDFLLQMLFLPSSQFWSIHSKMWGAWHFLCSLSLWFAQLHEFCVRDILTGTGPVWVLPTIFLDSGVKHFVVISAFQLFSACCCQIYLPES